MFRLAKTKLWQFAEDRQVLNNSGLLVLDIGFGQFSDVVTAGFAGLQDGFEALQSSAVGLVALENLRPVDLISGVAHFGVIIEIETRLFVRTS